MSRWIGAILAGTAAAGVVAIVGSVGLGAAPAGALASPQLSVTASGATSAGYLIFANSNLTGGSNPTGTITFTLFGPGDVSCASSLFTSTVPVSGVSNNSASYFTAQAGTYRWQSRYNGDANNAAMGPTACSGPSNAVTVDKARAYVSVTGSPLTAGAMHATASLTGGFHPSGTVTFVLAPPGDTFCSAPPVFTSTVAVNDIGRYDSTSYVPTVSGMYKWRVSYSGDANSLGGTVSSCLDPTAAVTITVTASPAALTYPANGQANVDTSTPFTWSTVPDAQAYFLVVGTTPGGSDLVNSGLLPPGQSSYTVTALPAGILDATLYTAVNGSWTAQSNSFTATPGEAALTYPTSGQTNVDTSTAMTWSTVPGAQGYYLVVGTTLWGHDLVNSGLLPPGQSSYTVTALPAGILYATLYTAVNGSWARYQSFTFTAVPREAALTHPTNGQTNVDTSSPLTWSTVPSAQGYYLYVGTTPGAADVVNSGVLAPGQSSYGVTVPHARTLYAMLFTAVDGTWASYQAMSFTTA